MFFFSSFSWNFHLQRSIAKPLERQPAENQRSNCIEQAQHRPTRTRVAYALTLTLTLTYDLEFCCHTHFHSAHWLSEMDSKIATMTRTLIAV